MGGTNAYVILEEAPDFIETTSSELPQLLPLSAKSEATLKKATLELRDFLKDNGRKNRRCGLHFTDGPQSIYTSEIPGLDRKNAIGAILNRKNQNDLSHPEWMKQPDVRLIFYCHESATTYVGMGRELYEKCEPVAKWRGKSLR